MGCVIRYKGQSISEEQFLQYLNKQITINRLFNENETLANSVYEALGFEKPMSDQTIKTEEDLKFQRFGAWNYFKENPSDPWGQSYFSENLQDINLNDIITYETPKEDKLQKMGDFQERTPKDKFDTTFPVGIKLRNKIHLFDGHHRVELAKRKGLTTIKMVVKDVTEKYAQITPQQKQQAQQLYSQYLESLNKLNTNPILQNNQQEQVKKFAELQERLNNKEFIEGAKNAYESSKGLQEWGTQEQYNDYIARVSLGIIKNPSSGKYNYTSKVKDIVYHGSKYGSLDIKNIKNYEPTIDTNRVGIFFSERKDLAKVYSKEILKKQTLEDQKIENDLIRGLSPEDREWYFRGKSNMPKEKYPVFSAIINLSAPKQIPLIDWDRIVANQKDGKGLELKQSLKIENYDSIKIPSFIEGFQKFKDYEDFISYRDKKDFYNLPKNIQDKYFEEYRNVNKRIADYYANQYAVFEPEQIHILSSKQDIQGFKEFVKGKQSITPRKGISELFSENPQLASIGTPEQYERYLSTIFPDSKIKDIVYHGTNAFIESFDKNKIASNTLNYGFYGKGFYFNETRNDLINWWKTLYKKEPNIVTAIINTKNPYKEASNVIEEKTKLGNKQETEEFTKNLLQKNYDAVLPQIPKEEGSNEYVVFEPEQIHVLSSKADIQGFKDFMSFENSEFSKYGTYQQFRDFVTSKSSIEIENRLIETGKIDRVC